MFESTKCESNILTIYKPIEGLVPRLLDVTERWSKPIIDLHGLE